MLNILICDDEKVITSNLSIYIKMHFKSICQECSLEIFNGGLDLLNYVYSKAKVDVIFLDIDLKDSNGIKIARQIRTLDKKVKIVFITNHKHFKSAAFSVRAFGYVEKPINQQQISIQLTDILNYMVAEKEDTIIKFETTYGLINISLSDIIYFENANRKIYIHTFANVYVMRQQLSKLYENLAEYYFERPHSSFLINLDYVIDTKNYTIYMINNIEIPLSQRKSKEFHKSFNNYLAKTIDSLKGE